MIKNPVTSEELSYFFGKIDFSSVALDASSIDIMNRLGGSLQDPDIIVNSDALEKDVISALIESYDFTEKNAKELIENTNLIEICENKMYDAVNQQIQYIIDMKSSSEEVLNG